MSKKPDFKTYVDVYSGAFDEYLSTVVAKAMKKDKKHEAIQEQIDRLYEEYPKVLDVFDVERGADLSKEECEALIQVMLLKNEIMEMELRTVYLRGCYDGVGYLKKAGIL